MRTVNKVALSQPAGDRVDSSRFPAASKESNCSVRVLVAGTFRSGAIPPAKKGRVIVVQVASEGSPSTGPAVAGHHRLQGFSRVRLTLLDHCIDEVHVPNPDSLVGRDLQAVVDATQELGIPLWICRGAAPQGEWLHIHPSESRSRRFFKRAVDIAIAVVVLILLLPVLLLIALAIRLTSAGPVLFKQPRVGYRRRQFMMLKFRTMVPNAEDLRHQVAALNDARGISFKVFADPRVTRVGAILRRTSLDEIPQLLNVIAGDMSLVGPRPIPVWVAEQLHETRYYRRFSVMCGLTGWWQVNGRTQDFDLMAVKDLEYVDRWSLALDLKIIAATAPAILRGEGSR